MGGEKKGIWYWVGAEFSVRKHAESCNHAVRVSREIHGISVLLHCSSIIHCINVLLHCSSIIHCISVLLQCSSLISFMTVYCYTVVVETD